MVRVPVRRLRRAFGRVVKPVLFTGGITAVILSVYWFLGSDLASSGAAQRLAWFVFIPVATLVLVCVVAARHELAWRRPTRRLLDLLPQIRAGTVPIEELAELCPHRDPRSGVAALVPQLQELLHDLRQQRVELAELNDEIRQRVQQRTDALERTVGALRQQATRDALTGLCNRRMLDGSLPQIIDSCRADGGGLCVLMIDVDHFKNLNDTLGHAFGDELLRDIGQLIRSTIRTRDIAFRFGGDEFTIVMPGATAEAAESLATRLASLVDARARTLKLSPRPRLSIGVAQLSSVPDATAVTLMQEADRKLYEVKSSRRSQRVKDAGDVDGPNRLPRVA